MADDLWFDGVSPVAAMGDDELLSYLQVLGGTDEGLSPAPEGRFTLPWRTPPYRYAGSQIGYIQAGHGNSAKAVPIVDPRSIGPETALAGKAVTIQITQALVQAYPGRGRHEVLLRFEAGDRDPSQRRHRFSVQTSAQDGDRPAVEGQVIFSGLPVGPDGLSVQLNTINVHSSEDARLAGALQSKVLHKGLDLAAVALGPATGLFEVAVETVADYISKRAENKAVQSGLVAAGFDRDVADATKLRQGTYVMVQAPATLEGEVWSWDRYVFDQGSGAIVKTDEPNQLIEFNYVAIAIRASS